jgi:hypothetical protein
VVVVG